MTTSQLRVELAIEGLDQPLAVESLEGEEAISELQELRLIVASEDLALDLEAAVGAPARVAVRAGKDVRFLHGILASFEQTDTRDDGARYAATLVPAVWLLDQGSDSRVFQDLDVGAVLARVLSRWTGVAHRIALARSYARRPICVQYRESDWAFASRLMEEEGLFHWFEHTEEGHVLVIADTRANHPALTPETIAYVPAAGTMAAEESIQTFASLRRLRPGTITGRSSAYWNAGFSEVVTATREGSPVERYEPGILRAEDRLEALSVPRAVGRGASSSIRLVPGALFTLSGHPRSDFNGRWLLTRVEHRFGPDEAGVPHYAARFECIPGEATFRPDLRTPRPRIIGPQTAMVVGFDGEEIVTDEEGRVLLHMSWERAAPSAESACWVPVAQMAAGAGFGGMSVPRVGSSVIVEFMDGDPDRPIVTGRVYNALSPHPYGLPAERSKSTWRTRSTPGGEGFNELRFEDRAGGEEVYLRAQRDLAVEALNDAICTVGNDDTTTVVGNRSAHVGGAEVTSVGLARSVSVGAAESKAVMGAQQISVGGAQSIAVGGTRSVSVGGDAIEQVTGAREVRVAASETLSVAVDRSLSVTGDHTITVGGSESTSITGTRVVQVGGSLQNTVDGQTTAMLGALQVAVEGETWVRGLGQVKLESEEATKIGAPAVYVSGQTLHLRAYTKIVLEVGSSDAEATRSKIEITTDGIYVTNGSSTKELTGSTVYLNC